MSFSNPASIGADVQLSEINIVDQAKGDILYYDGSQWQRLPKGTDNQILQQASDIPSWASPLKLELVEAYEFDPAGSLYEFDLSADPFDPDVDSSLLLIINGEPESSAKFQMKFNQQANAYYVEGANINAGVTAYANSNTAKAEVCLASANSNLSGQIWIYCSNCSNTEICANFDISKGGGKMTGEIRKASYYPTTITHVEISMASGNFNQYFTARLYKVKK